MNSGVYVIINIENNNFYIGSFCLLNKRILRHINRLKSNKHENRYLQNSWNKYDSSNFKFEILEECEKEDLIKREQYYIDILVPQYNICKKADSCLGRKRTEEFKNKMSKIMAGRKPSKETIEAVIKYNTGRSLNEVQKKKISESNKGRISPMKGKNHSLETIKKIREWSRLNPLSNEQKKHLASFHIGEKNNSSKLNEQKVKEIREKYDSLQFSLKDLGKEYQISRSVVHKIVKFKLWKHIK